MDCESFGPVISALYDGADVPPEAAEHIAACRRCGSALRDYAALSAEVRLLAAKEFGDLKMKTISRKSIPSRSSLAFVLNKRIRVPRFAAAICILIIAALAAGWARTRAQGPPQWFQYKVSFSGHNGEASSVGGVTRACSSPCEQPFMLSAGTQHIGMMLHVHSIEGDSVYLTVSTKQFTSMPGSANLPREMNDAPAAQYVYQGGETLRIPVAGEGDLELEGIIPQTEKGVPLWFDMPVAPKENEIAVRNAVLIRDGRVIAEMDASASARSGPDNSSAGWFAYLPQHGLFAVGLKPFDGAIEGTADYSQIRFAEKGVKYMLLSTSEITGGSQPKCVWILHAPDYRPSQHQSFSEGGAMPWSDNLIKSGATSNIAAILKQMGALPR